MTSWRRRSSIKARNRARKRRLMESAGQRCTKETLESRETAHLPRPALRLCGRLRPCPLHDRSTR